MSDAIALGFASTIRHAVTAGFAASAFIALSAGGLCRQSSAPPSPHTPAEPAAAPQRILVPKGAAVVVEPVRGVVVARGARSDEAQFEVAQDAIIDGHLIARAGDPARGTISVEEGPLRKREFIHVTVESITNFCGDPIAVAFTRTEVRVKQSNSRLTLTLPTMPGRYFIATLDRAQTICGQHTDVPAKPFPADALRSS